MRLSEKRYAEAESSTRVPKMRRRSEWIDVSGGVAAAGDVEP